MRTEMISLFNSTESPNGAQCSKRRPSNWTCAHASGEAHTRVLTAAVSAFPHRISGAPETEPTDTMELPERDQHQHDNRAYTASVADLAGVVTGPADIRRSGGVPKEAEAEAPTKRPLAAPAPSAHGPALDHPTT